MHLRNRVIAEDRRTGLHVELGTVREHSTHIDNGYPVNDLVAILGIGPLRREEGKGLALRYMVFSNDVDWLPKKALAQPCNDCIELARMNQQRGIEDACSDEGMGGFHAGRMQLPA